MPSEKANLRKKDRWEIDDTQKYNVLTPLEKETFGTHGEVVINYMNSRDVPPWFRGASEFQVKAANNLSYALRDDAEQRTTHRVYECLCDMGLTPVICRKDIRQLIRLCRGNDLAFLWFLFELHYKTNSVHFSINEQIILCLITHLDMIPTLRELDRVLPPPQPTKKEIARRKRKEELELAKSPRKRKRKHIDHALPYFQRLVRPKPFITKLIIDRPDFVVTFPEYEAYKDPNFVQPNETNRWFANYETNANRRIAQRIIEDEVDKIFYSFSKVAIRAKTVKTLCERHKTIEELEKKLESELRVIARNRCLKYFDTEGRHKEEVQNRIAEQIERDVAVHLNEFKKLAEKSRIESIYHVLTCDCNTEDGEDADEFEVKNMYKKRNFKQDRVKEERCVNFNDLMKSKLEREKCKVNNDNILERKNSSGDDSMRGKCELDAIFAAKQQKYINLKHDGMGDCGDMKSSSSSEVEIDRQKGGKDAHEIFREKGGEDAALQATRKVKLTTVGDQSRKTSISDFTDKYLKRSLSYLSQANDKTPTQSQTFFKAASNNSPYLFDYRKIFRFNDNSKESFNIKRAFLQALNSDIKLLSQIQDGEKLPDYEEPVKNIAKKMWKEELAKRKQDIRLREQYEAEKEKKKSPINYNDDYYDPDDLELMQKMLKDALAYIAKDPKFVLASIPQAHKLPLLGEWIAKRFGKVYTPRERFHLFKISAEIFRSLDKLERYVRAPRPEQFKQKPKYHMDYKCIKILANRKNPKTDYDDRMVATLMEQSRIFWYVMGPYLCSNGPPRDIYYSYMPSRPKDITRFRVWKPLEFMDAKSAWEERRRKRKLLKPLAYDYTDFISDDPLLKSSDTLHTIAAWNKYLAKKYY